MEKRIKGAFLEIFGGGVRHIIEAKAPGRVNIIGEHIDYQGGYVLPVALDRYIWIAGRPRKDKIVKLYSLNYEALFQCELDSIEYQQCDSWANYILGVIKEFHLSGADISGMELVFGGTVPVASGLSSSAAIEIAAAVFVQKAFGIDLPPKDLIMLARRAENNFVGVNCGIMDPFAIHLCKKDTVMLLNCSSTEYSYIPFQPGEYTLMLVDTKKERSLSGSVYNDRVSSVQRALIAIREKKQIRFLTELKAPDLDDFREEISGKDFNRAMHIVEENQRVLSSVEKIEKGDMEALGKLMYLSHQSLKELYEVSCAELDFIVDFCGGFEGCKGARLTGAGLGGCSIALIRAERADEFKEELSGLYRKRFGLCPEIYSIRSVDGAFFENCC